MPTWPIDPEDPPAAGAARRAAVRTVRTRRVRAACSAALLVGAGGASAEAQPPARPPDTVRVVAATPRFAGWPDTLRAGHVPVRLDNRGPDYHHVVLARLDAPGLTLDALLRQATNGGTPVAGVTYVGGPEGRQPTGPSTAVVRLAPGRWALLDLVEGADGEHHSRRGMAQAFTVVGRDAGPLAAAPGDVQVVLTDHAFTLRGAPARAGARTFWVTNAGDQEHHALLADLAPGRTLADVYAWFRAGGPTQRGPWPFRYQGGVTRLSRGQAARFGGTVAPGRTFLLCVNVDPATRQPHELLGMFKSLLPPAAASAPATPRRP